jgi:hypothetical protein
LWWFFDDSSSIVQLQASSLDDSSSIVQLQTSLIIYEVVSKTHNRFSFTMTIASLDFLVLPVHADHQQQRVRLFGHDHALSEESPAAAFEIPEAIRASMANRLNCLDDEQDDDSTISSSESSLPTTFDEDEDFLLGSFDSNKKDDNRTTSREEDDEDVSSVRSLPETDSIVLASKRRIRRIPRCPRRTDSRSDEKETRFDDLIYIVPLRSEAVSYEFFVPIAKPPTRRGADRPHHEETPHDGSEAPYSSE